VNSYSEKPWIDYNFVEPDESTHRGQEREDESSNERQASGHIASVATFGSGYVDRLSDIGVIIISFNLKGATLRLFAPVRPQRSLRPPWQVESMLHRGL
jgi:hypothetical protein